MPCDSRSHHRPTHPIAAGDGSTSVVKEKGLCSALFGVYFGSHPISPAAKEGVAKAFAELYAE